MGSSAAGPIPGFTEPFLEFFLQCSRHRFQKSFEGAIEKYFPNNRPTLYAATVYWYQAAGTPDLYQPAPVTERVGYWVLPAVKGVLEGENARILSVSAGNAGRQDMDAFGGNWSNNGAFNAGTGTVTLDGADQSILGTNTFNNLAILLGFSATSTPALVNASILDFAVPVLPMIIATACPMRLPCGDSGRPGDQRRSRTAAVVG
jgi:hypothetical protein